MEHEATTARTELYDMLVDETAEPKALPLSLLKHITGGFSDDQEIGRGGFAVVYKGIIGDRSVAVKRLSNALMDEAEFQREVECLMQAKHKNIVRFLGYCADRQGNMERYNGKLVMADVHQRLLCFDYIPNGSLDKYIIDPHREWGLCYKIIKGICGGLQSLHDKRIIHLDLKPANILLDNNMAPKITDFGLSRCFNENQSRDITKTILGTLGYLAPEYRDEGVISDRADLYSLGVIIIEILTGQKGHQDTEDVLESWRVRLERSQQERLCEQIRVCYETALECRDSNPMKRPASARSVIDRLHEMENIQALESSRSRLERSQHEGICEEIRVCYETALEWRHFNPMKIPASAKNIIDRLHEMESIQEKNRDKGDGGGKKKKLVKDGGGNAQKKNLIKDGGGSAQKNNLDMGIGDGEQKKTPDMGGGADKVDKAGSQSQPKEDKEKNKSPETTVLLRFRLHCGGCVDRIRRRLYDLKGVKDVVVDIANDEVKVVGTMDVAAMVAYLEEKLNRPVEVVCPSKKGHNKDNGGGGGDGEEKEEEEYKAAAAGDVYKGMAKGIEVAMETQVRAPSGHMAYLQPHGPPPHYYSYYAGNADQQLPYPYAAPPPQMFSDENPNACSVM